MNLTDVEIDNMLKPHLEEFVTKFDDGLDDENLEEDIINFCEYQIMKIINLLNPVYNNEIKSLDYSDNEKFNEIRQIIIALLQEECKKNDLDFKDIISKSKTLSLFIKPLQEGVSRRRFLKIFSAAIIGIILFPKTALGNVVKNNVNRRLPHGYAKMRSCDFILYHITGGKEGGINKIRKEKKYHFVIHRNGKVEPIADERDKVKHAGPTLWFSREENKMYHYLNGYSIGIACICEKEENLTEQQYLALRTLIKLKQKQYDICDNMVLPHAYTYYYRIGDQKLRRGGKTCGFSINRAQLELDRLPEDITPKMSTRKNIKKTYSPYDPMLGNDDIVKLANEINSKYV